MLQPQFISLPFKIPDAYKGFAEASGIEKASRAGLILEFEIKDGLFGVLRSGVRDVRNPLSDIASVNLQKGWFRTKLVVRVKSLSALSEVPGGSLKGK